MSQRIFRLLCLGLVLLPACFIGAQDGGGSEMDQLKERVANLEKKLNKGVTAGIDKRPFIQTHDGKFRLEFGGRLQARYIYQNRDNKKGSNADESYAEIERARIRMEGTLVDPDFKFRLEWDGHTDGESVGLTDAYLQYGLPKMNGYSMKVAAGQFKPYFGRQEKQSSAQQLMVDRSLANEYFNIDRNIGIWVEGRKELAEKAVVNAIGYHVAVTNGIDSVNKSPGDDEFDLIPAVIAHVDVDVMGNMGKYALVGGDLKRLKKPGLTTGASFMTDANNGSGGVKNEFLRYKVYQMAYDFVFKYMGFSLNGEYFGRWLDMRAGDILGGEGRGEGDALYTHGGYVESGYMLTEKLQVTGRASAIWDREQGGKKDAVEAGGGFNYFINGHNLKLSGDILYLDVPRGMLPMTEKLPGQEDASSSSAGYQYSSFSSSSANLAEFRGAMLRLQAQIYF